MNESYISVRFPDGYYRTVPRSSIRELSHMRIRILDETFDITYNEMLRLNLILTSASGLEEHRLTQHEVELIHEYLSAPGHDLWVRDGHGVMIRMRLSEMNFEEKDLQRISLRESRVYNCNFNGANLTGADFTGTVFSHCTFQGAKLDGANFSGAKVPYCDFRGVSLREYPNLEGVNWETSVGISALFIPHLSSRNQSVFMVHPIHDDGPVMFQAGCQFLTAVDFEDRVIRRKEDGARHPYMKVISLLSALNGLQEDEE